MTSEDGREDGTKLCGCARGLGIVPGQWMLFSMEAAPPRLRMQVDSPGV